MPNLKDLVGMFSDKKGSSEMKKAVGKKMEEKKEGEKPNKAMIIMLLKKRKGRA